MLGHLRAAQTVLSLDAIDVIIGYAVLQAGLDHLDQPGGDGHLFADMESPAPDHVRRSISNSALARSLGLPRETVRRRGDRLVERGILARDDEGLRSSKQFLTTQQYQTIVFSQMEPIFSLLLQLGYPDDPERGEAHAWFDQRAVMARVRQFTRLMLRLQLRQYETIARLGGGLYSGLLLSLVLAGSGVARLEPGERTLRPVSRMALAEALSLNRESTRRHLVRLVERGQLIRSLEGYLPSPTLLSGQPLETALSETSFSIRQQVRLLAAHGFVHEPHPAAGVAGSMTVR